MPLVMGVDSSTQSTKVEVRDADSGALVAEGRAPHPSVSPPRCEQDPRAWWEALAAAVGTAGVREIAAISVAGQQHGLVVIDGDSAVLRPAKLWNDTESAPDGQRLVERLGPQRWAERAGSVPVASFTVTKVAWLARREPEVLQRAARLLLPHDWLTARLTGRFCTDRGDASGTGYFCPAEGRWAPDLLALASDVLSEDRCEAMLPEVLAPAEPAGTLRADAAEALGVSGEPLVGPGTGDNMAAALGAGLRPGDVAISLGTSGTAYTVADEAVADATGAVAGFCDASGRFLPLVCVLNATLVTDTVARWLGVDRERLGNLALAAPPGAHGAVLVPHLGGERTPNRPDATGTLIGLRYDTEAADLARAAFEGVVCGLLDGMDALGEAGARTSEGRLVLVGGGARSPAYRRILAELAGRPVTVLDAEEPVATGAAVQAAACLHRCTPDEIVEAWALGTGAEVAPRLVVDAEAVRAAYAAARG